eukprot:CAMPEP_0174264710 /NCGR_PEP_ID=MMETSP0439-20130205/23552_1 /TAXON_ID=0 /ORGANISM="Stereomyxa ramosa, Strain Chinc5" /LENGTH=151 /DNA_ID=CAMNT_0015350737 /DNA_START=50 /DNA_END=502 /DNA_ORIENTATION=-
MSTLTPTEEREYTSLLRECFFLLDVDSTNYIDLVALKFGLQVMGSEEGRVEQITHILEQQHVINFDVHHFCDIGLAEFLTRDKEQEIQRVFEEIVGSGERNLNNNNENESKMIEQRHVENILRRLEKHHTNVAAAEMIHEISPVYNKVTER